MVGVVDFGVVFDLDGVLVNTEELGWQVWRSLAGRYGLELSLEDLRAITGCTDDESVQYFGKWLGPSELAVLGERFQTGFAAAKRERTRAYPDALETLTALQDRSAPVAVASNSTTSDVEAALKRAGPGRAGPTRCRCRPGGASQTGPGHLRAGDFDAGVRCCRGGRGLSGGHRLGASRGPARACRGQGPLRRVVARRGDNVGPSDQLRPAGVTRGPRTGPRAGLKPRSTP